MGNAALQIAIINASRGFNRSKTPQIAAKFCIAFNMLSVVDSSIEVSTNGTKADKSPDQLE